MFGDAKTKNAVTLSPRAQEHIEKLMQENGHLGLRLGVKKGGCAGYGIYP